MRDLINEILVRDLPSDQILDVCHVIREYRFAVRDLHGSLTPEAEFLASWRMYDCRERAYLCFEDCGLNPPSLAELI